MNPFIRFSRPLTALPFALAIASAIAFSASPAVADTLEMDTTDTGATTSPLRSDVSVHGMTQSQVRARFGEPEKRHAPVPAQGTRLNPPITRWDYDGFSVFFERDIAIHRVEHLKAAE